MEQSKRPFFFILLLGVVLSIPLQSAKGVELIEIATYKYEVKFEGKWFSGTTTVRIENSTKTLTTDFGFFDEVSTMKRDDYLLSSGSDKIYVESNVGKFDSDFNLIYSTSKQRYRLQGYQDLDVLFEYHYGNYQGIDPSLETMISAATDTSWTREYDSRDYIDGDFYEAVHHKIIAKKTGTTTYTAANVSFNCIVVEERIWENGTFDGTDTTYYDTGETWGGFVYSVSLDENQNENFRMTLMNFVEFESPTTPTSGNGAPGFGFFVLTSALILGMISRRN